jgi:hypothetical protein
MNNGARRILNRRLAQLKRSGCDFNKMHEYFGYMDTKDNIRRISLTRDMCLANVFKLTVTQNNCAIDPLQTYISELPRDMNNEIYSYLIAKRELKYVLEIPSDFPFEPIKWSLVSFKENGVLKSYSYTDPNEIYCGSDFSPAMSLDAQILIHLSRIPWLHDT